MHYWILNNLDSWNLVAIGYRASKPPKLIHSDLVGPLPTPSLSGSTFFVVFIDDYSCKF